MSGVPSAKLLHFGGDFAMCAACFRLVSGQGEGTAARHKDGTRHDSRESARGVIPVHEA